jgi:tetratricopeptide (TPR) repeat protein
MTRTLAITALLGLAAALTAYVVNPSGRQKLAVGNGSDNGTAGSAITPKAFPVCSAMGLLTDGGDWAAIDPDFAAGKRAMAAGDWHSAITALTLAGLRDDRNAGIQNYLGYAYRRLGQLDAATQHYELALTLNPRHRSAHEHLGEAQLMRGDRAKAEASVDSGTSSLVRCIVGSS